LWKKSWILHQSNAPDHNTLTVKQFLADKCIPVLEHPAYSPDLAPCDFYLFPKLKNALKGPHFQSVDEVNSKTAGLLNRVSADDLQHCFGQWKIRMQRCIDGGRGETTLKGIAINLEDFENKPDFSHQYQFLSTPHTCFSSLTHFNQ
jgi:hypothetical protein